jgi:LmbE family N-acetylglucosaminyl deacetylase
LIGAALAHGQILVVAPHPDDDLLTSAGVIYRAVQAGEPVTVVFMTNGDSNRETRYGLGRQAEAVEGLRRLGVHEEHLIFLGYPDGYLHKLLTDYVYPGETVITTFDRSMTYGTRGLGRMDYHSYRFGTPANYNRYELVADLEDILRMLWPGNIYVTSQFDTHPDHCATHQLLMLAVMATHAAKPAYVPTIHKTIVHWNHGFWPHPMDPTAAFPEIPNLHRVGLAWEDRKSLEVPLAMQSTDLSNNPKFLAIAAHVSQGGIDGHLKNYVHKDEFFWAESVVGAENFPLPHAGLDQICANR